MKSEELTEQQLKTITDSIDLVMDEYADDNKIIFTSESERAKHHFGSINRQLKAWKKSKQCMVPGCTERSIIKSHTIPKGMSLTQISEGGNLLTPEFDQHTGAMTLKSIGASLASTFPGFCATHERLYEGFETQKKLESGAHIYLQTYRAACREFFRLNSLLKQHEWLMSSYCNLRDERIMKLVGENTTLNGFPSSATFTSLSISNDPLVDMANENVSGIQELFAHVQDKILPALQKAVFNNCDDDIYVEAVTIDWKIPVALSGCAPFFVMDNDVKKTVNLLINVIPCSDHSILILSGHIDNKGCIKLYTSEWAENPMSVLSMIESWMVNGTDQWYIKPSVWNALPDERKEAILSAMFECEQNIGEEYGLSIFDEARNSLLLMLKTNFEPTQDKTYLDFVESQKKKMA